jgi:hypothetical protein
MAERIDMAGMKIGKWTVVSFWGTPKSMGIGKSTVAMWNCICDCGNEYVVDGSSLRKKCICPTEQEYIKNGGPIRRGVCQASRQCRECQHNGHTLRQTHSLLNRRFGKLVVIKKLKSENHYGMKWKCKCDCGKTHNVLATQLTRGQTRSCGCYRSEMLRVRNIK